MYVRIVHSVDWYLLTLMYSTAEILNVVKLLANCVKTNHITKNLVKVCIAFLSFLFSNICLDFKASKRDKVVTDSRLLVEEAMSAALLRECGKCKKKFYKEEGIFVAFSNYLY